MAALLRRPLLGARRPALWLPGSRSGQPGPSLGHRSAATAPLPQPALPSRATPVPQRRVAWQPNLRALYACPAAASGQRTLTTLVAERTVAMATTDKTVPVRTHRVVVHPKDNLALEYDSYGDSMDMPVILLHGGGQTRHSWTATAFKLAQARFNPITVDMRGHGNSFWAPDGDYTLPAYSSDLVALTQSPPFRNRPVVVVGASLATAIPNLEVAVLVDVTPKMERSGVNRILSYMRETMKAGFATLEEAAESIRQYTPNRARTRNLESVRKNLRVGEDGRFYWHWDPAFVEGRYYDQSHLDDEQFRALAEEKQMAATRAIKGCIAIQLQGALRKDSGGYARICVSMRQTSVPLLLIRGRASDLISDETAREFVRQVPNAEYIDVADAAHMVAFTNRPVSVEVVAVAGDSNDIFSTALIDFLERKVSMQRRHPSANETVAPRDHVGSPKL